MRACTRASLLGLIWISKFMCVDVAAAAVGGSQADCVGFELKPL